MADLVKQQSARPTNKLAVAGSGVLAGLMIWLTRATLGVDLPVEHAEQIVATIALIAAYFVPDRRNA